MCYKKRNILTFICLSFINTTHFSLRQITLVFSANLCDAGSCKRYNDSHHIDRKLKLQELGDAVVNISAPHDCFYNAGKVVICQNDVGCFFGNISPSNTLSKKKKSRNV